MSPRTWRKNKSCSSNLYAGKTLAAADNESKPSRFLALGLALTLSSAVHADRFDDVVVFNIPQQRADISLTEFAKQANITLIFPFESAMGVTTNRLVGEYSVEEAIRLLLENTSLLVNVGGEGQLTVANDPSLGETESMHKKNQLSTAVAGVISSLVGVQTMAQEAPTEEVIVTGIRASLERSMDIKREAKGVVDAISAEDIGKFPDSNLAESLQRITGVSIDRRNGEGSRITVRGFGPDFNMITLNGRMMPASSLDQGVGGGGTSESRGFDMDNIASEGVAGVEVYKTSKANIVSGGIGATINLKTVKPFDNDGLKFSFGAKALNDTTTRIGDDITPEFSGLISWADDDKRFGAAASFSYQERDSAATGAYVNQWSGNQAYTGQYPNIVLPGDTTQEGPATVITNEPDIGQVIGNPSSLRYFHSDRERKRTNAQVTLQFAPTEKVTATLDYTFAEQELFQNRSELSAWFQDFPRSDLQFDDAASPTPVLFWEESRNPTSGAPRQARDLGFGLQQQNQINELDSVGFNVEWEVTDELTLTLDAHDSSSETRPNAEHGNWANVSIGANVSADQGADWTGDLPIMMVTFDDSTRPGQNGNGVLDDADVGSQVMDLRRESATTDITQIRIDGSYEFSDSGSIDFGIETRKMEALGREAQKQRLLEGGWGIANPGDVPSDLIEQIDYAPLFDGYSLASDNQSWFDGVSGNQAQPFTVGYYGDAAAVGAVLAPRVTRTDANGNQVPETFSVFDDPSVNDNVNRLVEEEVTSLYFQLDLESTLGDMPVSILAGMRYESTTVTSTSDITIPVFTWQGNDDFIIGAPAGAQSQNFSDEATYDHLLPNLDIAVDLRDDLIARFSYSQTIARTTYDNLSTAFSIGTGGPSIPTILPGSVPGTATGGNPGVLPLESSNFDLSLEWYFGEASYASIGYFDKRVNNFVGIAPTPQPIYGILDPSNGPRAQQAVADLNAAGIPVNASTLFSQVAANSVGEDINDRTIEEWENAFDFVGEAGDPEAIFTARVPQNINDARIEGFELAAQHFFGDTGFGVQANYTIVNGDVEFDVELDPASGAQFALLGLSDTANLSLMYEKYGFSGRIAYNWRDEFLNDTAVTGNEPEFTEAYSQIDFSLSYEVTDGLFVSFEGINVTEEDQRKHGRSERQLTEMEVLGARYALGVRYSF